MADILARFVDVSAAVLDARILPALLADGKLTRAQQADRYGPLSNQLPCALMLRPSETCESSYW